MRSPLLSEPVKGVEQTGIVFIDEIDKIASTSQNRTSDISREGVQRDLFAHRGRQCGQYQVRHGQEPITSCS